MAVITEDELRQLWQNGRGDIPSYPAGTRFTPAAQDFLKSQKIQIQYTTVSQPGLSIETNPAAKGSLGLKQYPDRKVKVIYTEIDIEELALSRPSSLVITPEVILTDAAREKLFSLGIRVVKTGDQNQPEAGRAVLTDQLSPLRKTFYTESDVVEIAKKGVTQLKVNQYAVFTASAQEKLNRLGITLVREEMSVTGSSTSSEELFRKVKAAVKARLGGQVDEAVLDAVISKVIQRLK